MKVPFSWLKEFVDINITARALADKLLAVGFEVEEIIDLSQSFSNTVCGKILSIEKHPDADKLSVCQVDIKKSKIQIVTNSKTITAGNHVPVALDGAILATGQNIKAGSLRGVHSDGMFCGREELNLTENDYEFCKTDGVLILPESFTVGTDMNKLLENYDYVLDISVTANRPDCQSILGIAREVAAILKKPLKMPDLTYSVVKGGDFTIEVKAPGLCPRYMAQQIDKIIIKPSPDFIRKRLKSVSIRSINNIVDITNYVLIETGQPLHAFDKAMLEQNKIIVRQADKNEKIIALDKKEYILEPSMLVIADGKKPSAVAGIMGGVNSGVTENTESIIMESAKFARDLIRRTSKALGLRSDSSARFEKGIDIDSQELGLRRALHLIDKTGSGIVCGRTSDICVEKPKKKVLSIPAKKINGILGIDIDEKFQADTLNFLGITTTENKGILTITVPGWRGDIENVNDIAEEIIRFYGYDSIKPGPDRLTSNTAGGKKTGHIQIDKLKSLLLAHGCNEIVTYSFTTPKCFDMLNFESNSKLRQGIKLLNPLGEDWSVMRTTLVHSMLSTIKSNYLKSILSGKFFELAKVYIPGSLPLKKLPDEVEKLCIGLWGNEDFYSLKNIVCDILNAFRVDFELKAEANEFMHPGRTAKVFANGKEIGFFGELHPDVNEKYDLKRVLAAELDFDLIRELSGKFTGFKAIPKFPGVLRDFAFTVASDVKVGEIINTVKLQDKLIESVELFDIYKGTQIKSGYMSVAINIIFRAEDRTLTDTEVQAVADKILTALKKTFNAELRV